MYETILKALGPGNPRNIPNWENAMRDVRARLEIRREKYEMAETRSTRGIRLLRYILLNTEWVYFSNPSSYIDLYFDVVLPTAESFKIAFDHTKSGRISSELFLDGLGVKIPEVPIATSRSKPLFDLPLEKGWDAWKDIVPMRLQWFDSLYLNVDLQQTILQFKHDTPNYAIITLDPAVLILKYAKFSAEQEGDLRHFLKEYVLNSTLEDSFIIWVMNVLEYMVDERDFYTYVFVSMKQDDHLVITSTLENGLDKVHQELLKVLDLKISLSDFLHTDLFLGMSYIDLMNRQLNETSVDPARQSMGSQFLMQLPITRIIAKILKYRKDTNANSKLRKDMVLTLKRYKRANLASHLRDQKVKEVYEDGIRDLEYYLSS